jgi:hypothetical protein
MFRGSGFGQGQGCVLPSGGIYGGTELEAEAVIPGFDDVAAMGQAVIADCGAHNAATSGAAPRPSRTEGSGEASKAA